MLTEYLGYQENQIISLTNSRTLIFQNIYREYNRTAGEAACFFNFQEKMPGMNGYLRSIISTWGSAPTGGCTIKTALRENLPDAIRVVKKIPHCKSWREQAIARSDKPSTAISVRRDGMCSKG
jgi:hypothetical protein